MNATEIHESDNELSNDFRLLEFRAVVDRGLFNGDDSRAMPVYLFTFHAYGSWMPDRKRGYTKRDKGILPRDPDMANRYRQNMKQTPIRFDGAIQKAMIDETGIAARFQRLEVHATGSDSTHFHELISWRDKRTWDQVRRTLRTSLTRRLNSDFGTRKWFVESASRKRVREDTHFEHLKSIYLPDHPGWKWSFQKGPYR